MKTYNQLYTSNVMFTCFSNSLDKECCEPSDDDQAHFLCPTHVSRISAFEIVISNLRAFWL